jgi:hypothetical protein
MALLKHNAVASVKKKIGEHLFQELKLCYTGINQITIPTGLIR